MKKREFMQVFERGNVKDIMDFISNDKDFKEAHPLPDPGTMTRAEKISRIVDLIMEFSEQVKQEQEQEEYTELSKLLGFQCSPPELKQFYNNYIKRKQAAGEDPGLLIIDIFNYGIICGKRAERARRKGGAGND